MKYEEIKNLQEQELRKRLVQMRQNLFNAKIKHKMQRLSNVMELRNFKHDISRIQTALSGLPKIVIKKPKETPSSELPKQKMQKLSFKKQAQVKKEKQVQILQAEKLKLKKRKETIEKKKATEDKSSQPKKKKGWFDFLKIKKEDS